MIKGRNKLLRGIRRYATDNQNIVETLVINSLLRYYLQSEILRIDISRLPDDSEEVYQYLKYNPLSSKKRMID